MPVLLFWNCIHCLFSLHRHILFFQNHIAIKHRAYIRLAANVSQHSNSIDTHLGGFFACTKVLSFFLWLSMNDSSSNLQQNRLHLVTNYTFVNLTRYREHNVRQQAQKNIFKIESRSDAAVLWSNIYEPGESKCLAAFKLRRSNATWAAINLVYGNGEYVNWRRNDANWKPIINIIEYWTSIKRGRINAHW